VRDEIEAGGIYAYEPNAPDTRDRAEPEQNDPENLANCPKD